MTCTKNKRLAVQAAIALVLGAGVFLSGYLLGRSGTQQAQAAALRVTSGPLGEQSRRATDDPFALGSVDAPVVMVVFSDYRCPFCGRYSRVSEPELIERFVNSGQMRIEWRDLPLFGEASVLAARAGRAAAEQGRFWEFNQTVFANAPETGHHDLTVERLLDFALQVGIPNMARFEADMLSDKFDAAIAIDSMQARTLNLSGTPSFVIDGHPIVGAQPTQMFTTIIQQALATKR